jgi:tight adherence protein B
VTEAAAVVVSIVACCLLGVAGAVAGRRYAERARWLRLFRAPRVARPDTVARIQQWYGTLSRAWRSRGAAWWGPLLGAALGAGAGLMASGPTAAVALGAYGSAGVVMLRRRACRRARAMAHRVATDAVAALAADLNAGMAHGPALLAADTALRRAADLLLPAPAGSLATGRRVASAAAVSQASGAPLADILERLDTHLRALDRARAIADTQAAGARASATLLAAMPVAGVGIGMAIGIDPVRVLLHTTVGGAALGLAVALQLGGLAWTAKLARVEVAT